MIVDKRPELTDELIGPTTGMSAIDNWEIVMVCDRARVESWNLPPSRPQRSSASRR
jgi:hypothetical protein